VNWLGFEEGQEIANRLERPKRKEIFVASLFVFSFSLLISLFVFADASNDITMRLQEFHQDPSKVMDRLPDEIVGDKTKQRGFINYDEVEKTFEERNSVRQKIKLSNPEFKPWVIVDSTTDNPASLVDGGNVVTRILDLDSAGLAKSVLPKERSPWGDSYWPMHKGLIANRYADPGFPRSKVWVENYSYVMSRPAQGVFASGNSRAINNLSPAEKYDLLVGDHNMTLTRYAWSEGKKYNDHYGTVWSWMGICHGWSAAAHMLAPNITEPVSLKTPSGRRITFYHGDVKALNSMLWASASPPARFLGGRCKVTRPQKNKFGRIIDPICWDNNPATYHLALVNQVGRNKRSFVMDTTYDIQVWNFSIAGYNSVYFNPQTLRPTTNINQAIIPIEKYSLDKFKEFRSSEARYVVGVAMDVTYIAAMNPRHSAPKDTVTKTYRYFYDLELNSSHNIIGGEWYTNSHPDFIWTFDPESQATARGELDIDPMEWNLSESIPSYWTPIAKRASAVGIPLASVIKRIVQAVPSTEEEEGEEPPRSEEEEGVPTPEVPVPPPEAPSTPEVPGEPGTPEE
jgi:hypothetical protein